MESVGSDGVFVEIGRNVQHLSGFRIVRISDFVHDIRCECRSEAEAKQKRSRSEAEAEAKQKQSD
jgi:hypothetical protein